MAVNNSWLIDAVRLLKAEQVIEKDLDLVGELRVSQPVISSYLNNRVATSKNFIAKFKAKYPEIFEMSNKKISNTTSAITNDLKHNTNSNNVRKQSLETSTAKLLAPGKLMYVPLVNQYAYAGYLSGSGDPDYVDSLPLIPWLVDKEYKGNYLCFEVSGDSMNDGTIEGYKHGDVVLVREISPDYWKSPLHIKDWDFIVAHDESIVLKKIIAHDTEKGTITLHSLNQIFEDFTINLNEVRKLFNVIKHVRNK